MFAGWDEAVNTSFFSEMLQSIAERSRALIKRERREPAHERSAGLIEQCEELLSGRGEASGVALAQDILARYAELTTGPLQRIEGRPELAGVRLTPRRQPGLDHFVEYLELRRASPLTP